MDFTNSPLPEQAGFGSNEEKLTMEWLLGVLLVCFAVGCVRNWLLYKNAMHESMTQSMYILALLTNNELYENKQQDIDNYISNFKSLDEITDIEIFLLQHQNMRVLCHQNGRKESGAIAASLANHSVREHWKELP